MSTAEEEQTGLSIIPPEEAVAQVVVLAQPAPILAQTATPLQPPPFQTAIDTTPPPPPPQQAPVVVQNLTVGLPTPASLTATATLGPDLVTTAAPVVAAVQTTEQQQPPPPDQQQQPPSELALAIVGASVLTREKPAEKTSVSEEQWKIERVTEPELPTKRPSGVQWDRSSKRWRAFDYGDKSRTSEEGGAAKKRARKGISFSSARDACTAVKFFESGEGELPKPSSSVRPVYHQGPAHDVGMSDTEWAKARSLNGGEALPEKRPTAVKFFKKTSSWLVLECKRTGRPHLGYFKSAIAAAEAVQLAENPSEHMGSALASIAAEERTAIRERAPAPRTSCASDSQWALEGRHDQRPPGLTWSAKRRSWCVEKYRQRPWLGHFETAGSAVEAIRAANDGSAKTLNDSSMGDDSQVEPDCATAALQRLKKLTEKGRDQTVKSISPNNVAAVVAAPAPLAIAASPPPPPAAPAPPTTTATPPDTIMTDADPLTVVPVVATPAPETTDMVPETPQPVTLATSLPTTVPGPVPAVISSTPAVVVPTTAPVPIY